MGLTSELIIVEITAFKELITVFANYYFTARIIDMHVKAGFIDLFNDFVKSAKFKSFKFKLVYLYRVLKRYCSKIFL